MKALTHQEELAYYHNSYPLPTEHTATISDNLRLAALAVTIYETFSFSYVGYHAYTFTQETGLDSLIHLGSTAHMFAAALKTFIAISLHHHSTHITDRTPANTRHLTKSLFMITALALAIGTVTFVFLYLHNGTISIAAIVSAVLLALLHLRLSELKTHDKACERIIDLVAHQTKLD